MIENGEAAVLRRPGFDRVLPWLFAAIVLWLVAAPYPGFVGKVALRAVDLAGLAILSTFVLVTATGPRLLVDRRLLPVHAAVTAILIWQTATLLFSLLRAREGFGALAPLYRPVLYMAALWAGGAAAMRVRNRHILVFAWTALVLNAVVATAQFLTGPGLAYYLFSGRSEEMITHQYGSRIIGTLGNPNYLGVLMATVAGFFAFRFATGKGMHNALAVIAGALLVLLSQSRTSLAVLAGVALVAVTLSFFAGDTGGRGRVVARWLVLVVPAAVALLVLLSVLGIHLRYLWTGIQFVFQHGLMQQSSFAGRVAVWSDVWQRILQNPLVGWGPSTRYLDITFVDNNYIALLFRYGFIGFALTMALIAYVVARTWNAARRGSTAGALALMLWAGILLGSVTMDALESMRLTPLAFALSGVVLAAPQRQRA